MSRPPRKHSTPTPPKSEPTGEEDKRLWTEWTKSLKPLKISKSRVPTSPSAKAQNSEQTAPDSRPAQSKTQKVDQERAAFRQALTQSLMANAQSPSGPPASPRVPHLAQFDARKRRKLRSGRIEIAARLDLHGLTQHEAHEALRSFLLSSQARGLRWVLVITGKGSATNDASRNWDGSRAQGRGILRQRFPQWLAEPELRSVVVSHTAAAPHHGGDGARYVQLRARRR